MARKSSKNSRGEQSQAIEWTAKLLDPNRIRSADNVRGEVDQSSESFEHLTASIREHGLLEPLLVEPCAEDTDHYNLVAGYRRFLAVLRVRSEELAKPEAKSSDAPLEILCEVASRSLTHRERFRVQMIENLQRQDLNPLQEARAFHEAISGQRGEAGRLAKEIHRSPSFVSERLLLLDLSVEDQERVEKGTLTVKQALAIVRRKSSTPAPVVRSLQQSYDREHFAFLSRLLTLGRLEDLGHVLQHEAQLTRDTLIPLHLIEQGNLDLEGKPMPAITVDPSWLSARQRLVAKIVVDLWGRAAFSELPILGDALEEVGCGCSHLLEHCRRQPRHTTQCWVFRLLLPDSRRLIQASAQRLKDRLKDPFAEQVPEELGEGNVSKS